MKNFQNKMRMKRIFFFTVLVSFLIQISINAQTDINSYTFSDMLARQIGPAAMSGRITAIDGVNKDPRILYIGTAGGGVWKTITGGTMFKSVFDKYCQSIGAVTIDQKNPDVVWVGTGESNMRNSISIGNGVYKTDNGGDDWKLMGLEGTQQISKIIVDPENSDVVYVAAPGPLWSDSEDRGLYKTTDGGLSWDKILYVNEKTGCADIVMDPKDHNIIYASMWQFRRRPWTFSSGGEGSGLFKSIDGGVTWNRIDQSFSEDGVLGRICLAISPSDPNNIYAIAESKNTGLYNSLDGGKTWKRTSASGNVTARPFYFSVLVVDPTDPKRLYRPAFTLSISDDGGQSFNDVSFGVNSWVHGDYHALWVNPKNPQNLYTGTDGGVYVSFDRGNNWMFLANLPVSQYYHVTVDNNKPFYNVFGGLQDNGCWMGPSSAPGGVRNSSWTPLGFGDGFAVVPDLKNTDIIYWEWQGGNISRLNKKTNESKDIKPYPLKDEKLRFNWNTPIYQSPNHPGTIYIGAQFLYRSSDEGDSWEKISPDLTTNDPEKQKQEESGGLSVDNSSAENHCTIFTINESPLDDKIIWVGTDDGNLQVTKNGGKSWTNVVRNVIGVPESTWVSSVETSRYHKNTAYATFDGHALGDMNPYIYKTDNLGKTWRKISTPDIKGYVHKILEDPVNPNLLFAGTVFGLYLTIDGGITWVQYRDNVPDCEVRDMAIHPQTNDLVLATHGRGIYIIDDITPIRYISEKVLESEAYILPSRPNYIASPYLYGTFPNQAGEYRGPNVEQDAVITYYLKERAVIGDFKVEIYNDKGELMASLPGSKRKGINRITWDMRLKPPVIAKAVNLESAGFEGPMVPIGIYTVKLIKNDKTFTGKLEIKIDPNSLHSEEDIEAQNKAVMDLYRMQEDLAFIVDNILKVQGEAAKLSDDKTTPPELVGRLKTMNDSLESLRKTLVATKEGRLTGEERLRENLSWVYSQIVDYFGKPTDSQIDRIEGLKHDLDRARSSAEKIYTDYLEKINSDLGKAGLNKIELMTREEFDKKNKKK
jgi:photosystem II stability/assembly factor-like uncharacterized protein